MNQSSRTKATSSITIIPFICRQDNAIIEKSYILDILILLPSTILNWFYSFQILDLFFPFLDKATTSWLLWSYYPKLTWQLKHLDSFIFKVGLNFKKKLDLKFINIKIS